jgi:hypothetical protein
MLAWVSTADLTARQQLLDGLAEAAEQLGQALAWLGAAYELLDEQHGDRLEEELFRPVQLAYGRARRAHAEFAGRHGLEGREFTMPQPGLPSTGVRGFIEQAVDAVDRAEHGLVALQESPLALEVSDVELRAGLTQVRQLIDGLSQHARAFVRTFGR